MNEQEFKDLPRKGYGLVFLKDREKYIKSAQEVDWCEVAFLSTNSAYNLRTSLIENRFKEMNL